MRKLCISVSPALSSRRATRNLIERFCFFTFPVNCIALTAKVLPMSCSGFSARVSPITLPSKRAGALIAYHCFFFHFNPALVFSFTIVSKGRSSVYKCSLGVFGEESHLSHIQVNHSLCVFQDKLFAGLDLFAHEHRENSICCD